MQLEQNNTHLESTMSVTPRNEAIVETLQMISGLLLVLFLWVHMVFVASIWIGVGAFNALAGFMDKFGLLPVTIVFLSLVGGTHMAVVIRRMPRRFVEQKMVWKHAKLIHHGDTWSWVFQSITGSAIVILAVVHVAIVSFAGINANLSSIRVASPGFLIFYGILLLLSEYHASVGVYRIFVKWGFVNRHSVKHVFEAVSVLMIIIGGITLGILYMLGASK